MKSTAMVIPLLVCMTHLADNEKTSVAKHVVLLGDTGYRIWFPLRPVHINFDRANVGTPTSRTIVVGSRNELLGLSFDVRYTLAEKKLKASELAAIFEIDRRTLEAIPGVKITRIGDIPVTGVAGKELVANSPRSVTQHWVILLQGRCVKLTVAARNPKDLNQPDVIQFFESLAKATENELATAMRLDAPQGTTKPLRECPLEVSFPHDPKPFRKNALLPDGRETPLEGFMLRYPDHGISFMAVTMDTLPITKETRESLGFETQIERATGKAFDKSRPTALATGFTPVIPEARQSQRELEAHEAAKLLANLSHGKLEFSDRTEVSSEYVGREVLVRLADDGYMKSRIISFGNRLLIVALTVPDRAMLASRIAPGAKDKVPKDLAECWLNYFLYDLTRRERVPVETPSITIPANYQWAGKHVFPKSPNVQFVRGIRDVVNQAIDAKVIREVGELLELKHEYSSMNDRGYVRKNDVVPQEWAINYYSTLLRADSKDLWALLNRAQAYAACGLAQKAVEDLDRATRIDPRPDLFDRRGYILNQLNRYDEAIAALTKAINARPTLASAYNNRGNALHGKRQYLAAIADYSKAIQLKPENAFAFNNRGNCYRDLKQYDLAIADLDRAIQINPQYSFAYHNRGNAHQGKLEYDKAIADYSEAIRLDPTDATPRNNRGNAHRRKGEWDLAISDYDEAIRLAPNWGLPFNSRGQSYLAKHEYHKAIDSFDNAVRRTPNDDIIRANRGLSRLYLGRFKEAESDFDAALRIDPKQYFAVVMRGRTHLEQGHFDLAMADWEYALRISPRNGEVLGWRAWTRLQMGQIDTAFDDSQHAIESKNADTWKLCVRSLLLSCLPGDSRRNLAEAATVAERAHKEEDGTYCETWATLAAVHAANGDFAKAESEQETAVRTAAPYRVKEMKRRLELFRAKQPLVLPEPR